MIVTLEVLGYDKVTEGRNQLMAYLESSSAAAPGCLPLGDKSTPAEIWALFPGMSKGQFKSAVGLLLREGAISVSPSTITLIPLADRKPMEAAPYSGKAPKGWRPPANCTIFLGNLPFSATDLDVAEAIERVIGYGKLASVKVSVDKDSGKSRGFGHVEFLTGEIVEDSFAKLLHLKIDGRSVRIERKRFADEVAKRKEDQPVKAESFPARRETSSSKTAETRFQLSESSNKGKDQDRERNRDESSWCTVYVGDLPYKITDEALKSTIESALSRGQGTVAAVRQAKHRDTGLKRGFGYIDFFDQQSAERAVKELNGLTVLGRAIKLDLEGMKKRAKSN